MRSRSTGRFLQWMAADRPQDANNLQPRLGFAYTRSTTGPCCAAAAGLYYADIPAAALNWAQLPQKVAFIGVRVPTAGPISRSSPFNGPQADATTRRCSGSATSGTCQVACTGDLRRAAAVPGGTRASRTMWQCSIGFQRQLGANSAISPPTTSTSTARDENILLANINLTFNPATGANYPFANVRTGGSIRSGA